MIDRFASGTELGDRWDLCLTILVEATEAGKVQWYYGQSSNSEHWSCEIDKVVVILAHHKPLDYVRMQVCTDKGRSFSVHLTDLEKTFEGLIDPIRRSNPITRSDDELVERAESVLSDFELVLAPLGQG